jgi:uncharacterized protein DUF6894
MTTYYLNVRDDECDPDGSELSDITAARAEAIASARELMSQSIVAEGRIGIHRSFEIADANGRILMVVPFHEAAA